MIKSRLIEWMSFLKEKQFVFSILIGIGSVFLFCMILSPSCHFLLKNCARPVLSLARMAGVSGNAQQPTPYSMVFVTAPGDDVAQKIAKGLVSEKLCACVNIIPAITSVYEWEGKIESDKEVLMMIKTRTEVIPKLTDFVNKNHPYDVVEVISTSIEGGNQPYLDWIGKIVKKN